MISFKHALFVAVCVSLPGCQLLSNEAKFESFSSEIMLSHAKKVQRISDDLDQFFTQSERDNLLRTLAVGLENEQTERLSGTDRQTGAQWFIELDDTEWLAIDVQRMAESGVDEMQDFEFMDVPYRSATTVNIRHQPSLSGVKLGTLQRGDVFNVIAIVSGQPWYLISQQGVVKGFVHKEFVEANIRYRDILSTQPSPLTLPNSLASEWANQNDARPTKNITGIFICRQFRYRFSKQANGSQGQYTACRKQQNIWYIEPTSARSKQS